MVDGVMAGFSAFSGLIGMVRGLKDINDGVVRNDAIFAATEKALDLQQQYAAMAKTVGELEEKLAAYETWDSEKERYVLKPHGERGALAYALKEGVEPPEHPHSICPDCYQNRKKSILQTTHHMVGFSESLNCHACGWEGYTRGHKHAEHSGKAPSRRR